MSHLVAAHLNSINKDVVSSLLLGVSLGLDALHRGRGAPHAAVWCEYRAIRVLCCKVCSNLAVKFE